MERALVYVAVAQAIYFLVTGVWPIVHMPSFIRVTGAKTDFWLVKAVGALVAVIGAAMGLAAWRGEITPGIALMAVGSAAVLGVVDVVYVVRKIIAKIYLLDAVVEALLICAWATVTCAHM